MGNDIEESESAFFEKASIEIYDWLPIDKKVKFELELKDEGFSSITDLDVKERFFLLLHFLEVNYVKPVDWTQYILKSLERIGPDKTQTRIYQVFLNEEISLDELFDKLKDTKIKEQFNSVIESLNLKESYSNYLERKRGKRYFE